MNRNRKRWLVTVVLIVMWFCGELVVAQTVRGIEIARQSPVILFNHPMAPKLVVDQLGHLYFLDRESTTLQVFDSIDGKVSTLFTAEGVIADFAVDANSNLWIAITSRGSGKILRLSPSPADYKLTRFGEPVSIEIPGLVSPTAVAVDTSGALYVADRRQHAVLKVSAEGGVPVVAISNLANPNRMAVDAAGTLFVEDVGLGLVLRYRQGAAKEFLPLLGATDMAIDASGNLYFADKTGVRVVDGAGGAHARFAMCPTGASAVAVSSDGRLFALGEVGIFELPVTNTSVYDLGGTSLGGVSTGNLAVCNQLPLQSGINPVLSLAITGANASDFSQSSEVLGAASETGCSTHALLAKRTCLLTLHFSPTLTGTRSAVLSIKSNNVELLIPLSGTGVL